MGPLQRLEEWVGGLGVGPELLTRLVGSLIVLFAYALARRLVRRVTSKTIEEASARYQVNKALGYFFGFIAVGLVFRIWMQNVTGLATYLGLLSAGLAIALQDPIINLAGWIFILARRPFTVGDRIQIGDHAGDVVDVRIFQFTIMEIGKWVHADQATGRVIHVPNGWVFKNTVSNYDKGFTYLWNELEVIVTYESDWKRAKQVLQKTLNEHSEHLTADARKKIDQAAERYHIKFSKLTPVVWTSLADSGIRLTMRYLCKPRDRRRSQNEIFEAVLDAFAKMPDVDFAYPTTRRFDQTLEGKRALRSGTTRGSRPSIPDIDKPPLEIPSKSSS